MKDSYKLQLVLSVMLAVLSIFVFIYTISSIYKLNSSPTFSVALNPNSQLAQVATSLDTDPSLVGWWKFDDGGGTSASDSSGHGNSGTLVNGATWSTDSKVGSGSITFDGSSNYVTVPRTTSITSESDTVPISISFWVKPAVTLNSSTAGYLTMLAKSSDYIFRYDTGQLHFYIGTAKDVAYTTTLNANQWYHITGVKENNAHTLSLYLNGVLVKGPYDVGPASYNANNLTMGATSAGSLFFPGSLDDVRIYNRALSAAEVSQLYSQSSTGGGPGTTVTATSTSDTSGNQSGSSANASGNIYIGQTDTGSATGVDCSNTHGITWLNTASSWAAVAGKIGPGSTVHLCGTISTAIAVKGAGTTGNPITILFEPNARMSAPYWGGEGAIRVNGVSNIVVDGGTNGIIEATDDGTNFRYQVESLGVYLTSSNNSEVKNLTIRNLYQRTANSSDPNFYGDPILAEGGSNIQIDHNNIHLSKHAIYVQSGTTYSPLAHVKIYNNTITDVSDNIVVSSSDASSDDIQIYNNDISNTLSWDGTWPVPPGPGDGHHHNDGIQVYGSNTGSRVTNLKIFGNYIHGQLGTMRYQTTGWIFLQKNVEAPLIYNNVLQGTYPTYAMDGYIAAFVNAPQIYNNTIIGWGGGFGIEFGYSSGQERGAKVYNNIFSGVGMGIFLDCNEAGDTTTAQCLQRMKTYITGSDYNTFYYPSAPADFQQGFRWFGDLSGWQAATGFDTHSKYIDPQLTPDYHLRSTSPAVDAGTSLASIFTIDKDGNARPQGSAWDIGAYEYCTVNCAVVPIVPVQGNNPPVYVPSPNNPVYNSPPNAPAQNQLNPNGGGGNPGGTVNQPSPNQPAVNCPVTLHCVPITPSTLLGTPNGASRLASTFRFTRSLSLGQSGIPVKSLQIFLNDLTVTYRTAQGVVVTGNPFLVSTKGPGSKGFESTYFGPATKRALIKFQEYYASDILAPVHLSKGTGYFGPSTMKKVNGILGGGK